MLHAIAICPFVMDNLDTDNLIICVYYLLNKITICAMKQITFEILDPQVAMSVYNFINIIGLDDYMTVTRPIGLYGPTHITIVATDNTIHSIEHYYQELLSAKELQHANTY